MLNKKNKSSKSVNLVRDVFPVEGVAFVLGNDLAGGKVLLTPEVTAVPLLEHPDELQRKFLGVFPVCAVTRSMSKKQEQDASERDEFMLADSFLVEDGVGVKLPPVISSSALVAPPVSSPTLPLHLSSSSVVKDVNSGINLSRDQLIAEQRRDQSLAHRFEKVDQNDDKLGGESARYVLQVGVLVRRWTPSYASDQDDWGVVSQVVVPHMCRAEILRLAHDNPLAGHLGVNKTHDRILLCFFWPGMKGDVRQHCRTCNTCQVSGKPNQSIPPYPLYPIPVIGQPFDRVIVDCVGPLPRTKSGNQFLLTIMCSATRFPEAIPLRKITAIVKALVKYFSVFGLPKVIQSDQGSNFMSRVFAQVVKQLGISHCCSSAYHPESQGALERFHQTLKSIVQSINRSYCLEFSKDWDEGVHLLLFTVR